MGKAFIFSIAILLLVFLAACQTNVDTRPTTQEDLEQPKIADSTELKTVDLCIGVTCQENEICKKGSCQCSGVRCGTSCLSAGSCCQNSDCPSGPCENSKCVKLECSYNEELVDGVCECASGFNFCADQGKCISKDNCCRHTECPRGNRCVETITKTRICIELGNKKICRQASDNGREEYIDVNGTGQKLIIQQFLSNSNILVGINGENLTLIPNKIQEHNNYQIFQEGIETLGGFCKEDNDE